MNKFDAFEGFSENEQYDGKNSWGNPEKISVFLLWVLWLIRRELRKLDPDATITIHCAYEIEGHVGKTHPLGIAADWHVNTEIPYHELIGHILSILHQYNLTEFVGLGLYPDWYQKGFHVDVRGFMARWGYVLDKERSTPEKRIYKKVTFEQAKDCALLHQMEEES